MLSSRSINLSTKNSKDEYLSNEIRLLKQVSCISGPIYSLVLNKAGQEI